MADSDITVSGLALQSGSGFNLARWLVSDPNVDGPGYNELAAVELWAASANNRDVALKVDEGRNAGVHYGIVETDFYWYWIRPRNRGGLYGDWFPNSIAGLQHAEAAWLPYTPTLSASSGAFGSTTAVGFYRKLIADTYAGHLQINVTSNGTAAGAIRATLPFTATAPFLSGSGIDRINTRALAVQILVVAGVPLVDIHLYDGSYPGADGAALFADFLFRKA